MHGADTRRETLAFFTMLRRLIFWLWEKILVAFLSVGRAAHFLTIGLSSYLYLRLKHGKTKQRVVIVGGGFAGTEVAKSLQNLAVVDLIDKKEFFEFSPSVLRAVVQPQRLQRIQIPHSSYLQNCNIHVGEVTSIDIASNAISYKLQSTKTTETLFYDYLVIASGACYKSHYKNPCVVASTRARDLMRYRGSLISSNKIVVVGGGYVGVELAAEIVNTHPEKEVILIHNGARLLSRNTESASNYALNFFKKHGATVYLNENVVLSSLNEVRNSAGVCIRTESGLEIEADLAFICIGIYPVSSFIPSSDMNSLNFGFVKVNEQLQTDFGFNVFACGDIADINEEKLAQSAQRAAWVVSKNILRLHSKSSKLSSYLPAKAPMITSLGKYDAIFTYGNITICGFIPSLLKEIVEFKVLISYY